MWEIRRSSNRGLKNKGLGKDQGRIGKTKNVWPNQRENLGFIKGKNLGKFEGSRKQNLEIQKEFCQPGRSSGEEGRFMNQEQGDLALDPHSRL